MSLMQGKNSKILNAINNNIFSHVVFLHGLNVNI